MEYIQEPTLILKTKGIFKAKTGFERQLNHSLNQVQLSSPKDFCLFFFVKIASSKILNCL